MNKINSYKKDQQNSPTPQWGEIRWGSVIDAVGHTYRGYRPYLVISNNTFNGSSSDSLCIPFTASRWGRESPVHIDFEAGSISSLERNSTLMVENMVNVPNKNLDKIVHILDYESLIKVKSAISIQIPLLQLPEDNGENIHLVS